mgnify:FL=1
MSRLRKGGKYIGGSFAKQFSQSKMYGTPMFSMQMSPFNVAVAGEDPTQKEDTDTSNHDTEDPEVADAAKKSTSIKDIVPKKVGSEGRRSGLDEYWQKTQDLANEAKEAEERYQEEQARIDEANAAEEAREALSQGENIADSEGRRGRKDAKKDAKKAAKDEKRAKIAECKGLSGSAKRQCKKGARKDFRGDKKKIRQANRAKKRENFSKTKLGKLLGVKSKKRCTKRRKRKGKC